MLSLKGNFFWYKNLCKVRSIFEIDRSWVSSPDVWVTCDFESLLLERGGEKYPYKKYIIVCEALRFFSAPILSTCCKQAAAIVQTRNGWALKMKNGRSWRLLTFPAGENCQFCNIRRLRNLLRFDGVKQKRSQSRFLQYFKEWKLWGHHIRLETQHAAKWIMAAAAAPLFPCPWFDGSRWQASPLWPRRAASQPRSLSNDRQQHARLLALIFVDVLRFTKQQAAEWYANF